MGSQGAFIYDGRQMIWGKSGTLQGKNPVGCGDAFNAGFLACYLTKKPLVDCLRYAIACGSANTLSMNPGSIRPGSIRDVKRTVRIERISL